MNIQDKKIAIVGGGPGGLTLARLLQKKGVSVRVYERDANENARLIGSPLDMHEDSGMAALRKAGLVEEFNRRVHHGADRKIVVNKKAEVFFSDHPENSSKAIAPVNPEIDRGPLRNLLLGSLTADTLIWDSHFLSMEPENDGWTLWFKNGRSAYADLVVAADGANSKIRPYITDIKSFYTGITMLELNIRDAKKATPALFSLLKGGKVMAFGDNQCILGGQKGDGDLGFYAAFRTGNEPAGKDILNFSDNTQLLEWFKMAFPGWSETWFAMFKKASPPFIPRPIYCMPTDQSWKPLANITMLGDAAHVMPPFAGEGANTAMRDALELSEALTSSAFASTAAAIEAYETDMCKRASVAAKTSLENGERMFSENALEKMLAVFKK